MRTFKKSYGGEVGTPYRFVRIELRDRGKGAIINVLPDEVLLEVFSFYLDEVGALGIDLLKPEAEVWHNLAHVCRRWRRVVFASPLRLNLRLFCTDGTPVKKLLDVWPALPIVVKGSYSTTRQEGEFINIDAALQHNDRVCEIILFLESVQSPSWSLNPMKKSFPTLTFLYLQSLGDSSQSLVLPDSFLGGSAPRLRTLKLYSTPFPGLPKLLLSTHHLVYLHIWDIPAEFISLEAMVTCLSWLTNLKSLRLGFRSPQSHLRQTNRHLTPTVLPSLNSLWFKGDDKYLEDFMARIDIPLLDDVNITFFDEQIFNTSLLRSFISRTEAFRAFNEAEILFSYDRIDVILLREVEGACNAVLQLGISSEPVDQQLSTVVWVCNLSLPPLPTLERLNICGYLRTPSMSIDRYVDDTQWLELLHPFITVKSLYLDMKFTSQVARGLQELTGERVTEVLPALQHVFIHREEPVPQGIAQLISARQLLGHQVSVQGWDEKRRVRVWEECDYDSWEDILYIL